jgi:hypothetical protein
MNETEVKKMLTAAQAYIVYLEKKELTLLEKTHELACEVDDLKDANAILKTGNEGFTNTLKYYAATVGKLEEYVDSLKKTINKMNGVSKWTEVEV